MKIKTKIFKKLGLSTAISLVLCSSFLSTAHADYIIVPTGGFLPGAGLDGNGFGAGLPEPCSDFTILSGQGGGIGTVTVATTPDPYMANFGCTYKFIDPVTGATLSSGGTGVSAAEVTAAINANNTSVLASANTLASTVANNALTSANTHTNTLGQSAAADIGGGAAYNPATGQLLAPTINAAGKTYNTITGAIQALNSSTVQYDSTTSGAVDLTSVTLDGVGGTTLRNLKAGVTGTDAANTQQVTDGVTASKAYADSLNGSLSGKYDGALNSVAASLGGGAVFDPATGAISAPTITAAGQSFNNTTGAIQALDASAVQYDKTATGAVDTSNLTFQDASGTTLHNVAAGVAATDAVNKGQLDAGMASTLTAANAYTDGQISTLGAQTTALSNGLATTNTTLANLGSGAATLFGAGTSYNPLTGAFSGTNFTIGTGTYDNVGAAVGALNTQNQTIGTSTAANIGAGSTYDPVTGTVSAPAYSVGGVTHNNTGAAVTALDSKTDTLGTNTAANIGGGAVFDPATGAISAPTITSAGQSFNNTTGAIQALDASAVQYDKTATGAVDTSNLTFQDASGTTLHNVAAGVAATDAVNKGQLNTTAANTLNSANAYTNSVAMQSVSGALNAANNYTNQQVNALATQTAQQFGEVHSQIQSVGSLSAALSGLIPNFYSSKALQVQAAIGYGNGASAIGAGTSYSISPDILVVGKIGVSTVGGVSISDRVGGSIGISIGL